MQLAHTGWGGKAGVGSRGGTPIQNITLQCHHSRCQGQLLSQGSACDVQRHLLFGVAKRPVVVCMFCGDFFSCHLTNRVSGDG